MKQLTIMLISLVTKYWVDSIHFHVSKWRFIIILWNYLIITSSAKMTFLGMLFRSVKLPLEENYHEYIFLFFLKVIYTNVPIKYLIGLSKIIYMVYLNTWQVYIYSYIEYFLSINYWLKEEVINTWTNALIRGYVEVLEI